MGSSATIYVQSFINTGSGIQKLIDTQKQTRSHKPTFVFQNKESRLKTIRRKILLHYSLHLNVQWN
jgi:predicted HTH transcriptional regulator